MFRPLSLLASQIAPTAAGFPTGQPRLLRPGISCFVTSARSGYAIRPIQVIDGERTFTFPDLQLCRLLQCLTSLADVMTYICPLLTSAPRSGHLSTASVTEATRSRSPGVSSTVFRAQPPNLRFAPLMDMDFAVSRPLVRTDA